MAELEKEKYKIENSYETIKNRPNRNGCLFWYSTLNEYRAKHAEDFKKLAVEIENFYIDK